MSGIRIRWQNVARTGAIVAAAAAAIAFVPWLLTPPEPPPVPEDVGLATGASGFVYEPPRQESEHRRPRRDRGTRHRHAKPEPVANAAPRRRPKTEGAADTPPPPVQPPASEPSTPTVAPSPAPVVSAPAPEPSPPPESASGSQVEREFGFEP